MKLDHDCVRDLLLVIEKHGTLDKLLHDKIISFEEMKQYDVDTIVYTAKKLVEAGYITANTDYAPDGEHYLIIGSITYEGHLFLNTIRDPKVWKHVKQKASALTSVSLSVMGELGTAYIKNFLGI